MLKKKRQGEQRLAEVTPHYLGHRQQLRDRFREAAIPRAIRRRRAPTSR
jgi:hypothetical protein